MPQERKTADLIKDLCVEIGHEEGIPACTKKLVNDNWIVTLTDLKRVEIADFEKYGLPLKLCLKIVDKLADLKASDAWGDMQSTINYSMRPAMAKITGGTIDFLKKKSNPEDWAVKKLQRAYRKRRALRLRELASSPQVWTDAGAAKYAKMKVKFGDPVSPDHLEKLGKMLFKAGTTREEVAKALVQAGEMSQRELNEEEYTAMDEGECSRMNDEEAFQLRKRRAEEKIRRCVRRWKMRRDRRLAGFEDIDQSLGALVKRVRGSFSLDKPPSPQVPPKECEVTTLLKEIGIEQLQFPEDEVIGYIHQAVTQNWIETLEDLDQLEERHWKDWGVPEAIRLKVVEYRQWGATKHLANFHGAISGHVSNMFGGYFAAEEAPRAAAITPEVAGPWICKTCGTRNPKRAFGPGTCTSCQENPDPNMIGKPPKSANADGPLPSHKNQPAEAPTRPSKIRSRPQFQAQTEPTRTPTSAPQAAAAAPAPPDHIDEEAEEEPIVY